MLAALAVTEVTVGKLGQWHVHIHALVSGEFIPHPQLKAAWLKATGDSFVVGIEAVNNRADAAKYVASYIAGGNEVFRWEPEKIREYSEATHGRRMIRTYGKTKLEELDRDSESDTVEGSAFVANITSITRAEAEPTRIVRHAISVLACCGVTHARVLGVDRPERTLRNLDGREINFAVAIAEEVERSFPAMPEPAALERLRRYHLEQMPTPPPSPLVARTHDVLWIDRL